MKLRKSWIILTVGLLLSLVACGDAQTPADQAPEPTAEAAEADQDAESPPATSAGEEITLYVGPETAECEGEGPQTCLLVKESPESEYELFYSQIEGFEYEPGFEYELEILVEPVANPPAGGSSLKYTLVSEHSKTPVTGEEMQEEMGDSLANTAWLLTALQEDALLADSEITLLFAEGGISGNAGCNGYFGSYELDGENIIFGPIGSTEAFCSPETLMAQETAYLTAFASVAQYRLENDELLFTDANGNELMRYQVEVPLSLTDTLWQVIGYNNGQGGVVSVVADTEMTAVFAEDGSLTGSAGCNSYNTTYTVAGDSLSISELLAVTLKACAEEIMAQEGDYLAALPLAATYDIQGDRLQIRDADGALLADYIAAEQPALAGTTWVVTAINNGNEAVTSVINGMRLTAVFQADGTVVGDAGCNAFNGSYTVDGSNMSVGPLASTQKACTAEVMQQETAYLTALQSTGTYSIQGDNLELRTAEGALAVSFMAEEPSALSGSEWDVISYNNGQGGVVSLIIGTEITANFGEDGSLTGLAGCNNYNATYEVAGKNITIGPAVSTRMFCAEPEGIMEQETAYLAALETAVSYRIDGPRLEMRTAEGALVANFQAAGYVDPEIITFLENGTYQLDLAETGEVTLTDGETSEPIVAGSATELSVSLTDFVATGMLEGQFAVAAIIVADAGGSGTFYYLSVFTASDAGLMNTATTLLGDRVQVNGLDITGNTIVVDMVQAGADDPLCCPTEAVINVYELQGDELEIRSSEVQE